MGIRTIQAKNQKTRMVPQSLTKEEKLASELQAEDEEEDSGQ